MNKKLIATTVLIRCGQSARSQPLVNHRVGSLRAEAEHNAARIAHVVLMAAEASGAVDLGHHVLDLNRLKGYVIGQLIVHATAGRGSKAVLRCGSWATPHVPPPEKQLHIRRQPLMPPA